MTPVHNILRIDESQRRVDEREYDPLVVTVTPNVAVDKTYVVEEFRLDRMHRPSEVRTVAGGKGINVARVLSELGRPALATGFVGGRSADEIVSRLDAEGLGHDFVRVREESRLCIKIMDPVNGTQTEINENGPTITEDEIEALFQKLSSLVTGAEFVTLCGNCPPGVPATFYAKVIGIAKKAGSRVILDASGDDLAAAIKAGPYMVKPNLNELSELAGRELVTIEEITQAAKSLKQFGVSVTAVTVGRSGAIITDGVRVWLATPPEIEFASAVGSGDAFLAAFIDSAMRGEEVPHALVWAVAAGAANATTFTAGSCSKERIMDMVQGVTLTKTS